MSRIWTLRVRLDDFWRIFRRNLMEISGRKTVRVILGVQDAGQVNRN
jgi:hypothetical protein